MEPPAWNADLEQLYPTCPTPLLAMRAFDEMNRQRSTSADCTDDVLARSEAICRISPFLDASSAVMVKSNLGF